MVRTFPFILALAWSAAGLAQSPFESDKAPPQRVEKAPSAAAGGTAPQPQDPAEAQRLFRELDRNGDGYLNTEELWSRRTQERNWAAVDRDGDGRIAPAEFTVIRR
jgi:hypothetical protein